MFTREVGSLRKNSYFHITGPFSPLSNGSPAKDSLAITAILILNTVSKYRPLLLQLGPVSLESSDINSI